MPVRHIHVLTVAFAIHYPVTDGVNSLVLGLTIRTFKLQDFNLLTATLLLAIIVTSRGSFLVVVSHYLNSFLIR